MKRLAIVTGILALAAPLAMAQYSTWASDPAHSEVDFSIKHGGVSNVHGRFGKVTATLVYNETTTSKAMHSSTPPSSPPPPSLAPT
jgi:polyisoprenoid-binding protein YceI